MCVLQRYALIMIGATALVAAIHGPRATGGLRVYSGLIVAFRDRRRRRVDAPFVPAALSAQGGNVWLRPRIPGRQLPLTQALPKIFAGTGGCSSIDWTFLGLTIPEWTLVWFAVFAAAAIWAAIASRRPK